MCHRQLRFSKSTTCGHLIFTGQSDIDCNQSDCYHSVAHSPSCRPCTCRRFYTQPERTVTAEVPERCSLCR
ncbi:hypothetical protein OF83DRAFT_1106632, partial [Amylostereum chailletii]